MMSRLFKRWANKSYVGRFVHMLWECRCNLVDVFAPCEVFIHITLLARDDVMRFVTIAISVFM